MPGIEIAVKPQVSRPLDLILDLIKGTTLPRVEAKSIQNCFIWSYPEDTENWEHACTIIHENLVKLGKDGLIYYGHIIS